MKKNILLLLVLVGQINLFAQITIDNSVFPVVGDTLFTATDNLPSGINLGEVGGDQIWDFSSLQAPFTNQQLFLEPTEGQAAADFPTADVLTDFAGQGEAYYSTEENEYILLGYSGIDPAGFGLELLTRLEPPLVERRAPMNFLDINTTEYNLNVPFSAEALPEEILENLPITPDSLRIRTNSNRTDVVDAWGNVTIPGGTFDVLREKRIEYRDTRLDVKVGAFPWQDVTELFPFGDGFLGTDTIITYNFFGNEIKEPVAVVTVSPDETEIERVTFKSIETTTSTLRPISADADIVAYPNPAIDSARFEFSNLKSGQYDLKIYNILGVVVWEQNYKVTGTKTVLVDLSDLKKGTYLYSIQDEKGKTLKTKRLLIIRP